MSATTARISEDKRDTLKIIASVEKRDIWGQFNDSLNSRIKCSFSASKKQF